jgi:hypothetical protein
MHIDPVTNENLRIAVIKKEIKVCASCDYALFVVIDLQARDMCQAISYSRRKQAEAE